VAMSLGTLIYLTAMAAIYVAQRLLEGHDGLQGGLTGVALVGLAIAAFLRFRRLRSARDGLRLGHRVALMFLLVGCGSLVMYAATTDGVVRGLTLAQEAEDRWLGVWRSLWPVVWLLGTVPLLVLDHALVTSPVMTPTRRVRDMVVHGLVAAMGVALVFPVNYIANERKERWDLAYFKTPTPGTATQAVAEGLQALVHVRIFMPPSSEVAQELKNYFGALESPNLRVEVIDQAAEPRLAKALSVRDNGMVTFTQGEVSLDEPDTADAEGAEEKARPVTRTLRVSTELEQAKRTLKKLDAEVQRILIEIGHGERVAYVTKGHGELTWKGQGEMVDLQMKGLHELLKQMGFKVKELGLSENLATKVPDDADLVLVLGPQHPFQQAEADSLRRFLDGGGALLVAFEPRLARERGPGTGSDPLEALVEGMGLRLGDGVLAAERDIVPMTRDVRDRFNIATNAFSQHPSSQTLSTHSSQLGVIAPVAGHLEEVEGHDNDVTFTVRSLAIVWADLDLNAEFDADAGETKAARNLVAAVTGGGSSTPWRAVVTSDATMFADLVIANRGNQVLIHDAVNWLIGAEAFSGTTESEEDVRIEHTKEGQITWFYLTVLAVPLAVVALGALRVQLRLHPRRKGPARPAVARRSSVQSMKEEPTGKSMLVDDDALSKASGDPEHDDGDERPDEPDEGDSDEEKGGDR
jgi:hypothetical protein